MDDNNSDKKQVVMMVLRAQNDSGGLNVTQKGQKTVVIGGILPGQFR